MTDEPLALVGTETLLKELLGRFNHAAFIGLKCDSLKAEGRHTCIRRWCGNPHTAMGLCHDLASEILCDFEARQLGFDMRGEEDPA